MRISDSNRAAEILTSEEQAFNMRVFYKLHARLYDATRWAFLFGRNTMLKKLPIGPSSTLLEVGCGTGRNLRRLASKYPDLKLIGVDVSPEMLERATRNTAGYSKRVFLFESRYAPGAFKLSEKADGVLFSYSLTMFNPGWEEAIERAFQDLKPGGYIAMVDFQDTNSKMFRWWMTKNHVRMYAHLLPAFQLHFETIEVRIRPAFLGLWRYVMFLGRKPLH